MKTIYLDYAASTPAAPEVADCIYQCLTDYNISNASSQHANGYKASQIIESARESVANLLNVCERDIVFTSGATESNNLALLGLIEYMKESGRNHIVTSSVEHKAVLDAIKYLESNGTKVSYLSPDQNGLLNAEKVRNVLTADTALLSVMHVNNETGTIQNISLLGEIAKENRTLFHVDAAQSAGKLKIDIERMNVDLLSLSAHKFYGPKGIGGLYLNPSVRKHIKPLFHGGSQEHRLRPGTYPIHQIAGLGKAAEIAVERMNSDYKHAEIIRKQIMEVFDGYPIKINGGQDNGLPNILNISLPNINSVTILTCLQDEVAISSGSACNSGTIEPSHVLAAMGIHGDRLEGAIRISFGRYTTHAEAVQGAKLIRHQAERINNLA